ncbi:MAG: tetratricopeptide repeat protein [bacterium]
MSRVRCRIVLLLTVTCLFISGVSLAGDAAGYLRQGIDFANQGLYDEAINALQQALELDETDVSTLSALGTVYMYQGKSPDAIKTLQKAIEADPEAAVPHYVLAMIYETQSVYQKSVKHWKNFIELSTDEALKKEAKKHIERLTELQNEK